MRLLSSHHSLDNSTLAFRLAKTKSLLSPHAKVSFRDGEHTYIMRMTNSSYPVAWLIAEEEAEDYYGLGEEDYSEEDNSAWNECDNYILRSSVSPTTGPLLLVQIVETLCSDWWRS